MSKRKSISVKNFKDLVEKFNLIPKQVFLGTQCLPEKSECERLIYPFFFFSPQKWKMAPMKEDFRNKELTFHYKDVFALSLIPFFFLKKNNQ